jgi:DNA end-binding protein Ku
MLEPYGKGMLATTLHYAYQVRDAGAAFEDIADLELQEEMLDLAAHIIDTKASKFDVSRYEDRYENALIDLVKAKQAGREIQQVEPRQPTNVINLMDALRRSVASEGAQSERSRGPEDERPDAGEAPTRRRAAAAASAKDEVRKSPRARKAK